MMFFTYTPSPAQMYVRCGRRQTSGEAIKLRCAVLPGNTTSCPPVQLPMYPTGVPPNASLNLLYRYLYRHLVRARRWLHHILRFLTSYTEHVRAPIRCCQQGEGSR
jgi:hypothetical protein